MFNLHGALYVLRKAQGRMYMYIVAIRSEEHLSLPPLPPPTPHSPPHPYTHTHTFLQGTISGILRGSGRQLIGAGVNFVSYYVIGLPIAIVLALVADLGALGVWSGLIVADILQVQICHVHVY